MGLSLSRLLEPTNIKELIKQVRKGLGKVDNIDYNSQATWNINRLSKYLWNEWKDELQIMAIFSPHIKTPHCRHNQMGSSGNYNMRRIPQQSK